MGLFDQIAERPVNEIEFIASHFHELDISRLEKFEQLIVERILSC
jgi:hypothetical protein